MQIAVLEYFAQIVLSAHENVLVQLWFFSGELQ